MSELSPELILNAYSCGVFPMGERKDSLSVMWVDPDQRGIIPLNQFHLPRRLAKTIRSGKFGISVDTDFETVIKKCSEQTVQRQETWINDQIIEVYCELYKTGNAHSVECWRSGKLVGGLYGVAIGSAFFGESMFNRSTDASKVALVHLIERLKAGGYSLLDTQFLTSHLTTFGAIEISRKAYLEKLRLALRTTANFYPF